MEDRENSFRETIISLYYINFEKEGLWNIKKSKYWIPLCYLDGGVDKMV